MKARGQAAISYRPDIDGLRAVAVLLVVAFHVTPSYVTGGYIGVDVFFVISGFLIASLIATQLEAGTFSLATFYKRRLLRIAPAYVALLAVLTIAAVIALPPPDLRNYAESLAASVASLSNVYFYWSTNYFHHASHSMLLLHTWSLSVEEQYYLVFPLLCLIAFRQRPQHLRNLVAILLVVSLAGAIWLAPTHREAAFYLLPLRAWELLTGAFLATWRIRPSRAWQAEICGVLGLLMIAGAGLLYTNLTPFPGLTALLPCMGAALVIYAGCGFQPLTARLLSFGPIRFVGLISYSLYLWHWPIIGLQQDWGFFVDTDSRWVGKAVILALSFGAATASWILIERPFRNPSRMRPVAWGAAGAFTTACVFAMAVVATNGFPWRFSPEENELASHIRKSDPDFFRAGQCFVSDDTGFNAFDRDACLARKPGQPSYLLLGDSHAASMWTGLAQALPHVSVLQTTAAACAPMLPNAPSSSDACAQMMGYVARDVLQQNAVDKVVLAARWNMDSGKTLEPLVRELTSRGLTVVIIGPTPIYQTALPRLLISAVRKNAPTYASRFQDRSVIAVDGEMARIAAASGALYISMYKLLCPDGVCQEMVDGAPLLFDTDHLTYQGSLLAGRLMAAQPPLRTAVAQE